MNNEQILREAIKTRNVRFLVKYYWGFDLVPGQVEIVRIVAFEEVKKLIVCAMTRYGKTFCVALGICLHIMMNENKKYPFIGPKSEQAGILRDYMQDLVLNCRALREIAQLDSMSGHDKLRKEASKKRLTFVNGCEYRVFSAHGDAEGLMGFGIGSGGGILTKDEATLINDKASGKIGRMKGDNPDETMEIELLNPWEMGSKAYEHWLDSTWHHIHIDWRQALKEGRTTQEFVDEQRKELTPLEFQVLYDSNFPDQSEDSIFNLSEVRIAENSKMNLIPTEKQLKDENFIRPIKIISCDVADKGLDRTVIYWGREKEGNYQIEDKYSEAKSENTAIAGRINNLIVEFIGREDEGLVNIDCIGVGAGVLSMVNEFVNENGYDNVQVNGCHFGKSARKKERFSNQKAENYFKLNDLFNANQMKIPSMKDLKLQLMQMKWEFNSTKKIRIIDPSKSPDFADGLVYFIWTRRKQIGVA